MRKATLLFALSTCFLSIGCKWHEAEVISYVNERSLLVREICEKVAANPTEAGIGEARNLFDAKRPNLTAKWDALKKADLQFDEESMLLKAQIRDVEVWKSVGMKLVFEKELERRFSSLEKDFDATLKE